MKDGFRRGGSAGRDTYGDLGLDGRIKSMLGDHDEVRHLELLVKVGLENG